VREAPGQAEQDPGAWIRALRRVARRLAAAVPPPHWRALGLSGMIPTLVTVDTLGRPVGAAPTWQDARADAQAARLRSAAAEALGDPAGLYRRTGQRLDGRYLLPMAMRIADEEPRRAAATALILGAKDFLFGWLTGVWATDPSTASGYGCYDLAEGRWLPEVVTASGLAAGLPPIMPSTTTRPLSAAAATLTGIPAGLPVCLGAADSVAGMLALGVTRPGDVAYITGTSTVIAGVSAALALDLYERCLVTPLATPDGWGLEMDLVSTGSAVAWLARILGLGRGGEHRVMELAAAAPDAAWPAAASAPEPAAASAPGPTAGDGTSAPADEPLFLPFLGRGEQGALWDPDLRGTILGLDLSHGREHIARALVDGLVLESCRCFDVLTENGLPPAPVRAAGAGASSPFLRRQLADASGRDVLAPADPGRPFSALGAALLACRALGRAPEGPRAWTGPLERTASDPSRRSWWDQRRTRHDEMVTRIAALYRRR